MNPITTFVSCLLLVCALHAAPAAVSISEFLAANVTSIRDEDGDSSDWIELRNSGTNAVDLNNWTLTDDPEDLVKWRLPDVTLPAGVLRRDAMARGRGRDRAEFASAGFLNLR